jgi:Tol biopolymer transport system component
LLHKEDDREEPMFLKILLKEWRENILVFSLAVILMLALVVLNLTDLKELTLNFSGMFLIFFLPFAALLIGSSAFYSEFKDNAWIYLFSRPIKKEVLWVLKFISLLSILLAIFLMFFVARQFLPRLNEVLDNFAFPQEFRGILSFSMYFVIPLVAFVISFSISILHEKQFVIFFISGLIGTVLMIIYQQYLLFMERVYYYPGSFKIFSLFIALSFILASLITFVKYDFSQMGKKILTFTKFAVLFLVASLALSTIGIARGELFTGSKDFYPFSSLKYEGDVYTFAYQRGISRIIKYDSESDRMEKISEKSSHTRSRFSIGGENIIYLREARLPKKYWLNNIWVVNTDGTGEKALVEVDNPDSPVYNHEIMGGGLLSSDGEEVIFLTYLSDRNMRKKVITVWWMNVNGSGIKKKILEFPRNCWNFQLLARTEPENHLILMYEIKSQTFKPIAKRVVLVNLEDNSQRTICENVIEGIYTLRTSPTLDHLALASRGEPDGKERLIILDLMTLEKKTVFEADLLKLWAVKWSQDGRKILFSRTNELWAYFLDENRLQKVSQRNYGHEIGFDWLADNKRLVLIVPVDGEYHLSVLSEELKEVKRIKTPYQIEDPIFVWGLNNTVLLKFQMGPLFRLDLETEKWKKVY